MRLLRDFLRSHRALAMMLVALALVMKALVPAGYMVGAEARTISVVICDGVDHGSVHRIVLAQDTGDHAGHHQGDHGSGDRGKADGVCPYAAMGHAGVAGADPVLLAAALGFILALAFAPPAAAPRRRMAHIRPPLRGPPGLVRPA